MLILKIFFPPRLTLKSNKLLIQESFTLFAEYAVPISLVLNHVNCSKFENLRGISRQFMLRANCSVCVRPVKICIDSPH